MTLLDTFFQWRNVPARVKTFVRQSVTDEGERVRHDLCSAVGESVGGAQAAIFDRLDRAEATSLQHWRTLAERDGAALQTGFSVLAAELRSLQRQQAAELADINRRLDEMAARIDAVHAGSVERQMRLRDEMLMQLSFSVHDFKHAVTGPLAAEVTQLCARIEGLSGEAVGALRGEVAPLFDRIAASLADLDRSFAAHGAAVPAELRRELSMMLGGVSKRVEGLHTALAAVPAAAAAIRAEIGSEAERVLAGLADLFQRLDGVVSSSAAETVAQLAPQLQATVTGTDAIRVELSALAAAAPQTVEDAVAPATVRVLDAVAALQQALAGLPEATADRLTPQIAQAAADGAERQEIERLVGDLAQTVPTQLAQWAEKFYADMPKGFDVAEPVQSLTNIATDGRYWAEEAYKWAKQAHDGITTHLNNLESQKLDGLIHQVNNIQSEKLPGLATQVHHAIALHLEARAHAIPSPVIAKGNRYKPATPATFDAYVALAEKDFPKVFVPWWDRFNAVGRAFDETKIGNVANERDLYSRMFRDFLKVYAGGRLLDVGCGVFGRPYYLQDYTAKLISAIEPLPMKEAADFELVRGLGEYLPWPDGSFNTVVSGTSLDHCLSLERSLSEIRRVLAADGRLLLWLDIVPGSPAYEPSSPSFVPADQYHLFHFDKPWLEPMLEQDFVILERVELDILNIYSKAFYALSPRQ